MPVGEAGWDELRKVALGEAPADLAIINGDLVNVYTGEVQPAQDILVKGGKIAYAGRRLRRAAGPETRVIDAAGRVIVPGFIDTHTHLDWIMLPEHLIRYAMLGGTTTIIAEVTSVAFPQGYRGVREFILATRDQPVRIYINVPSMVSISPVSERHALDAAQARRLFRRSEVIALGEPYWGPVVRGNRRVLGLIEEAHRAGKMIDGHTAGAVGQKLQAYAALGITSCHEPITAAEVLERLRLGMYVLIREGEVRRELEEVAAIRDAGIDFRLLALSSDGPGPWQLKNGGYMEYVVQKAIDLGFDPVTVYQMASLNAAQRFGLADAVGGVAPGKYADIVILPDLKTVRAEYVVSRGRVVAEQGRLNVDPRKHRFPRWLWHGMKLPRPFTAADFDVAAAGNSGKARVRVLDLVSALVSREAVLELPVIGDQIRLNADEDVIKIAAIEHTHQPGKMFTGFVRGLGLRHGAVATSTMWDTSNIGVAGADEADMALAANRLVEMGGGLAVCAGGRVLAEFALPIAGLFSPESLETIMEKLDGIQRAADGLGCNFPDIRLTLSVLSAAAIPFLRISESGLFDLKANRPVGLLVE